MALIVNIEEANMERNSIHRPVEATFSMFKDKRGDTYLQIDTYGSKDRAIPGKKSQTLQFGPEGLRALRGILAKL